MKQNLMEIIHANEDLKEIFIDDNSLEKYIDKILQNAHVEIFLVDENIAGFIAYYCNDVSKQLAFLTMLCVHPTYYGKGIGKKLLNDAIVDITNLGFAKFELEVKTDNNIAKEFYNKMGFKKIRNTTHSIIMQLEINGES